MTRINLSGHNIPWKSTWEQKQGFESYDLDLNQTQVTNLMTFGLSWPKSLASICIVPLTWMLTPVTHDFPWLENTHIPPSPNTKIFLHWTTKDELQYAKYASWKLQMETLSFQFCSTFEVAQRTISQGSVFKRALHWVKSALWLV